MRIPVCFVTSLLFLCPRFCTLELAAASGGSVHYWLAAGLGASSLGFGAGSVAASMQLRSLLLSARATANASELFGGEEYCDVGLLAGYAWQRKAVRTGFAAGCVLVTGQEWVGPWLSLWGGPVGEWVRKGPALGFAVEGQFQVLLNRFMGVGMYAYYDLNHVRCFGGATVTLIVGRLR